MEELIKQVNWLEKQVNYLNKALTDQQIIIEELQAKANKKRERKPVTPKYDIKYDGSIISGIDGDMLSRWQSAFPAVEIAIELKRATLWLDANPAKRKKNLYRFLTNWFSRCQERGGSKNSALPQNTGYRFAQ